MIGGRSVKVKKIMACNDLWLSTFYYWPIQAIESKRRTLLNLGCSPVNMTCTYCGKKIRTLTQSNFNFVACGFCMLFNWLYCCVQLCRNKNVCCSDITHRCPRCGVILGEYNSC